MTAGVSAQTAFATALDGGCCTNRRSVRAGVDDSGMAQNFIVCDREQEFLLPPSLCEWLPKGHSRGS
jgi:hypothetical protein